MKLFLLALLLQLHADQIFCALKIRGLSPDRASLYDPKKNFACLDGSSVIPFDHVNDDYCDCRDGSDEPGTSACMNGSFACENIGYIVQMIPSSRVNDGICDCCDGSDEYDTNTVCENKCIALAAKMKEEEERQKTLRDQGFLKRKELIEEGSRIKKSIEEQIQELESKKINAESEKSTLEETMKEIESKAKEAKEKQDQINAEKLKESDRIEKLQHAKELFEFLDVDKDLFIKPEELLKHSELDILFDNDGKFTMEESVRLLDQNGKVNFELFVEVYYEKFSPHISMDSTKKDQSGEQPTDQNTAESQDDNSESHEENEEHGDDQNDQEHDHDHESEHTPTPSPPADNQYDQETKTLIEESEKARHSFEEAERELRKIETEISNSKKKLGLDLGQNSEFASMINSCFELEDREYTYKLCPFDRTVQKSKSSGSETTIGNWAGWGSGENKYHTMVYNNGLPCWNGPQRSTKVIVTCGVESRLFEVSEPNRCEYEMKFETPAVCEEYNATNEDQFHQEL